MAGPLASFALVVGLLTLTPGLDTALILRTAVLGRRRQAWGVVLGIQTGTLVWGTASAAGISVLLTASRLAYETLHWAGVCYLLWTGVRMLRERHPRRDGAGDGSGSDSGGDSGSDDGADGPGGWWAGWRRGTLTNLLNPKVGVFYVAVLPPFIPAGAPHLAAGILLTSVHVAEGLLWSAALIAFAHTLRTRLRRPAVRRLLDRATGVAVLGFGAKLALGD
ncbi:threonine/homoserine/homoserine lactone efflux protein [Kitasatospora sp. SolWspMP-SS2h]|uniref:LysE family translocator n=1 Tax=Kitasatospora sp. SolWspMP-SS2h TaxID=1305729 RepID=UPI000DB9AAC4|nr:LysE family translocator [Kitasatospora sp. SolWspMP-SS2h]RAJ31987.1 threonine/homoserine/homoserine lactone efflux protein [Kitasatospora sp. SolWspMP-SS2h]